MKKAIHERHRHIKKSSIKYSIKSIKSEWLKYVAEKIIPSL